MLNSLPPPSPLHPSGLSQCKGCECRNSCIEELGLLVRFTYGSIHVSMLFSQIIPPLPSPPESKSLFFTPVSLSRSCTWCTSEWPVYQVCSVFCQLHFKGQSNKYCVPFIYIHQLLALHVIFVFWTICEEFSDTVILVDICHQFVFTKWKDISYRNLMTFMKFREILPLFELHYLI